MFLGWPWFAWLAIIALCAIYGIALGICIVLVIKINEGNHR